MKILCVLFVIVVGLFSGCDFDAYGGDDPLLVEYRIVGGPLYGFAESTSIELSDYQVGIYVFSSVIIELDGATIDGTNYVEITLPGEYWYTLNITTPVGGTFNIAINGIVSVYEVI